MAINTLNEYKEYAGFDVSDASKDVYLSSEIELLESEVLNYLGRSLEIAEYTEYYDGDATDKLILKQYPIIEVDELKKLEDTVYVDIEYDRLLIRDFYLQITGNYFPRGVQNIEVVYTAGYSEIPGDIKTACKQLFSLRWKDSPVGGDWLGVLTKSRNSGGASGTDTKEEKAYEKILSLLNRYKNVRV